MVLLVPVWRRCRERRRGRKEGEREERITNSLSLFFPLYPCLALSTGRVGTLTCDRLDVESFSSIRYSVCP